jgi:phosphoserine phosphatase
LAPVGSSKIWYNKKHMNIKLICFDLDQTLITHSSWKELGLALGISYKEDSKLYEEYKSGLVTYDEWNNKILNLYLKHNDANKEEITKILSNYSYNKGAREIIEYLKSRGYILVLISGSIDILVSMVAKDLGIKFSKANNSFIFDEKNRIKAIQSNGDDTSSKMAQLNDFCKMLKLDLKDCACIADGANDIEMFRQTKHGITFKGSIIENEAWKVIESFEDLKRIF